MDDLHNNLVTKMHSQEDFKAVPLPTYIFSEYQVSNMIPECQISHVRQYVHITPLNPAWLEDSWKFRPNKFGSL